jgi:hypothetical protein
MRRPRFPLGKTAAILVVGFTLVSLAHVARPLGSLPLFDGVGVVEPYRYLDPPAPPREATPYPSDPTSYTQPMTIKDDRIPPMFAGTTENPPQAQMFTSGTVFDVPPGTTEVVATVAPVRNGVAPPDGHITGNVYHFSIATPDGTEIHVSAGKSVSIVLRIPHDEANVTIDWFDGQRWLPLPTEPLGVPLMYKTNAAQLGDFALVVPGEAATSAPVPSGQTLPPLPSPGTRTATPSSAAGRPSASPQRPPATGASGLSPGLAVIAVVLAGLVVGLGAAGLYLWQARR